MNFRPRGRSLKENIQRASESRQSQKRFWRVLLTLKQNNICISQLFRHIHQIQQTRLVLMKAKAALGEGMSNSRNSRWTKVANGGNKNYILPCRRMPVIDVNFPFQDKSSLYTLKCIILSSSETQYAPYHVRIGIVN